MQKERHTITKLYHSVTKVRVKLRVHYDKNIQCSWLEFNGILNTIQIILHPWGYNLLNF